MVTDDDATCGHCLGAVVGAAFVDQDVLCHTDEGMDCYRLVTVYRHPMPCRGCWRRRLAETWVRTLPEERWGELSLLGYEVRPPLEHPFE